MEELRSYSKYLVLAIAILGSIKYKDLDGTKAKYFLFSIWYIVITEFVGHYFYSWFNLLNYVVYNIYTLVQITFFLLWYRSLLESLKRRKVVLIFALIYISFWIINAIFFQNIIYESVRNSFTLGVIFLVTSICYYLVEVFNSERVLSIRRSVYFWFSFGILLFFATYLPFYYANKFFLFGDVRLLSLVNFILCVVMYLSFGVGILNAKHSANEHKL